MTRRRRNLAALLACIVAAPLAGAWIFVRATRHGLDALEARLLAEIEAERRRPPERLPVLRGSPREGDAIEGVAKALGSLAAIDSSTQKLAKAELERFPYELRWTKRLEELRARLAPGIAALRSAVACESVRVPYVEVARCPSWEEMLGDDVRARWASLGVAPDAFARARLAFDLEAARALACGATRESARIWTDGRRLTHILARLDNWCGRSWRSWWRPIEVAFAQHLDEPGLVALEGELLRLEESVPNYANALRRERLDFGRELVALRASGKVYVIERWESDKPSPLARFFGELTAQYRLWRGWERLDAALRELERQAPVGSPYGQAHDLETLREVAKTGSPFKHCPASVRLWWSPTNGNVQRCWIHDVHLAELAQLRLFRAVIAAFRFHRAHARWPTSHAEALGRAPRSDELDPLTDGPFAFDENGCVYSSLERPDRGPNEVIADADGSYLGVSLDATPPPRAVGRDREPDAVSMDLTAKTPAEAIAALTSRSFGNVLVAGWADPITVSLQRASAPDAIASIASAAHCDIVALPGGTVVLDAQPRVTIQFRDPCVAITLELLAAYSGRNILVGPEIDGRLDAIDLVEVDWRDALDQIADKALLDVHMHDGVLLIRKADDPRYRSRGSFHRPFPRVPKPELLTPASPTLTVAFDGTELRAALAEVARSLGIGIELAPGIDGTVKLSLRDAPWEDLLTALAISTHTMIEQHEKTIRFSQAPTIQAEWCRADLLFELLGERAGKHMDVEPSLRSALLSFDLGEVPYDETISHVASKYWLDARKEETGFTIAVPAERKRRELYDRAASARPAPAEQEPAEMTPENRASLEKWIAGKLGEIAELAASGPRSACEYRIGELGWVNGTYRRATISEGRRQHEARADLPRDVRHLVELELLALEGNVLARDVERLLDAHRFDDVPAAIDRLDAFLARAPREKLAWGREYFWPQLEGEARQLRKELTLRRELWTRLRAEIIITAIVLEPEPSRCAAIINDRVYRVGDELRGADGKAVAGLKVVKIVERRVRLSLDGVEFFRPLREK